MLSEEIIKIKIKKFNKKVKVKNTNQIFKSHIFRINLNQNSKIVSWSQKIKKRKKK